MLKFLNDDNEKILVFYIKGIMKGFVFLWVIVILY